MGVSYTLTVVQGVKLDREQFKALVPAKRNCNCELADTGVEFCFSCGKKIWTKSYWSYDTSKLHTDDGEGDYKFHEYDLIYPSGNYHNDNPIFIGKYLNIINYYSNEIEEICPLESFEQELTLLLNDIGVKVEEYGLYCFMDAS